MTRSPALAKAGAALASIPALSVLIALVTWPGYSLVPQPGLDPSWETGITLAAQKGLDFGTEIVFTYGPLGFLFVPSAISSVHAVLAALFLVAMRVALAAVVMWAAGRAFPLPVAFVIALVTSALVQQDELVVIAFVTAAVAISDEPPSFVRPLLVYGGGVLSAVAVLGKLSFGVVVLALCVVGVAGMEGRRLRNLALLGGVFAVSTVTLWLATGHSIGTLPDYVRHSNEVVSGFASAMMTESPPAAWDRVFTAIVVAGSFVAVVAISWRWAWPRRLAALVLLAVLEFTAYKQGFVRHDSIHMAILVPTLLAPWVAFRWEGPVRFAALVAIAAIAIAYFPLVDKSFGDVVDPVDRSEAAYDDLRALLIPGRREDVLDYARTEDRKEYELDAETLAAVGDEPVTVYPWETSMVWAYNLNWRPLPVFQSYTAYTHELDALNADALESPDGPQRVLRHVQDNGLSIDSRYGPFEAPATTLAMLCNFEALRTTTEYQVLGRVANRCGEPQSLETVDVSYGQWIDVPKASSEDEAVIAVVRGLEPGSRERLRTLLYRGLLRAVVFDDMSSWRVIPDTIDGMPIVLTAPEGVDFPKPFALAPDTSQFHFFLEPGFGDAATPLNIEFLAMPVEPMNAGEVATGAAGDED